MTRANMVMGIVLALAAASIQAHTHLKKSTPADGSVVTASPPSVELTFSEAARLTAAWIQKDAGAKEKLTSLPEAPASQITVSLPVLMPGTYVLSWRALSDDGHVVPGQIRFTVSAGGAPKDAPR